MNSFKLLDLRGQLHTATFATLPDSVVEPNALLKGIFISLDKKIIYTFNKIHDKSNRKGLCLHKRFITLLVKIICYQLTKLILAQLSAYPSFGSSLGTDSLHIKKCV